MSLADYKASKAKIEGHQITTQELCSAGALTLKSMTLRKTRNGQTCLVRFKEDPEGFYFGGKTTVDLYEAFKEHDVDLEKEEVKVQYSVRTSEGGRDYVAVDVL